MVLSDRDIKRRIANGEQLVSPYSENNLQPASIDLTLAKSFRYMAPGRDLFRDIQLDKIKQDPPPMESVYQDRFILRQGQYALGSTHERVIMPYDLVANVEGKSSLARLGLFVHITAGFIDPGFQGTITLEFLNMNSRPIELVSGLRICQIAFNQLSSPADHPYGSVKLDSKYQNQYEATESRYRG